LPLSRGLGRIAAATIAAHELGHVLGLGHEPSGCSVMAPVVNVGIGSRCGIGAGKILWCCLLHRHDIAGAATLYGRRPAGWAAFPLRLPRNRAA
jgi:hypothetical protein